MLLRSAAAGFVAVVTTDRSRIESGIMGPKLVWTSRPATGPGTRLGRRTRSARRVGRTLFCLSRNHMSHFHHLLLIILYVVFQKLISCSERTTFPEQYWDRSFLETSGA